MTLIDTSYFIRELYIPNLLGSSEGDHMSNSLHATNQTSVEEFIDKYEYEFLIKLLGKEFADYILAKRSEEEFATLLSLIVNNERKISPIANYVFVMWSINNKTHETLSAGTIVGTTNYSKSVLEPIKERAAWNDMVGYVEIIREYLHKNRPLYLEYLGDELGQDIASLCRTWNSFGL